MIIKENENERRQFFRIEDSICLQVEKISPEEYAQSEQELAGKNSEAFLVSADFVSLNNEFNHLLNKIKTSSSELAQYLELLNRKIDLLGHHLLDNELPCTEADRVPVNLSAAGIAFDHAEPLDPGQQLRIRMVLFPEKIGILAFGVVVDCRNADENSHKVCAEISHIREQDQELMIKHNLNKQMEELRESSEVYGNGGTSQESE